MTIERSAPHTASDQGWLELDYWVQRSTLNSQEWSFLCLPSTPSFFRQQPPSLVWGLPLPQPSNPCGPGGASPPAPGWSKDSVKSKQARGTPGHRDWLGVGRQPIRVYLRIFTTITRKGACSFSLTEQERLQPSHLGSGTHGAPQGPHGSPRMKPRQSERDPGPLNQPWPSQYCEPKEALLAEAT